ncbi:MAG: type VI secretion system tube protein Hcp [Phycisphaerales bacterium]|nr:type VI secretion system tube protein Hcp [Phycisphaerales bacterium]
MADTSTAFLRIPGVRGTSSTPSRRDWIDVLGTSFKAPRPRRAPKDGEAFVEETSEVIVVKSVDAASPVLAAAHTEGRTFTAVEFELVSGTKTRKVTLEHVLIGSYAVSNTDPPTETITLAYVKHVIKDRAATADDATVEPDRGDGDAQPDVGPAQAQTSEPDAEDAAAPAEVPHEGGGPVGTGERIVRSGECTASIAKETGHFWRTIWDDAGNADLRAARENPFVLLPGDRVHVPALRQKWEPGDAEKRHRFRRKGEPEVLRLRILSDAVPRGNEPFVLVVDGVEHRGSTDADGNLVCPISPAARRAHLRVGESEDALEYEFDLGHVDPVTEISGVQGRLKNLGFDCGRIDGKLGKLTRQALRKYQKSHQLRVTGEPDEATRRKLQENYGC